MSRASARCVSFAISFGLFSTLSSMALGQTCDPDKILRQNIDSYRSNFLVWLSYVNNLTVSKQEESSGSIGLSYAGIGLSLAEAQALSQFISQQTQYNLSTQQSVSVLRSTLSSDSVKAYIACLDANKAVAIIIPDAALNQGEFLFSVDWNPKGRINPGSYDLEILVVGGKLEAPSRVKVQRGDSTPFGSKRDLTKQLFVSAKINGQTDIVSLPPVPSFVMKVRERVRPDPAIEKYSDDVIERDGGHGTVLVQRQWCISSKDDSNLIPSTMKFIGQLVGDTARVKATIDKDNSSLRACGTMIASSGCNECYNAIRGHFSVWEAYLEQGKNVLQPTDWAQQPKMTDVLKKIQEEEIEPAAK